jgi:hypothetical protein
LKVTSSAAAVITASPDAIPGSQRELVVPRAKPPRFKRVRQWADERLLILGGMRYEDIELRLSRIMCLAHRS